MIMKSNNRSIVRVIKRGDVHSSTSQMNGPGNTILEMEQMIRSWVQEVRTNRVMESRITFNKLFGNKPVL